MRIELDCIEPIEEAFKRLRNAPLDKSGNETILVYRDARFRLCDYWVEALNLTSRYVVKDKLDSLRALRAHLLERFQIDILQSSEVLHLKKEGGKPEGVAPPVVEIYEEAVRIDPKPGDREPPTVSALQVPILKDGIHRAWIAREERLPLRCVVVSGAIKEFLPYAYPNSWSEVMVYEKVPDEDQKKHFRRQERYSYLRPLRALRGGDPEYGRPPG